MTKVDWEQLNNHKIDRESILYDHAHIDSLDANDLSVEKISYITSLMNDIPKSESAKSIIDDTNLEINNSNTENNSINSKYLYLYVNIPKSEPFYLKLMLYRNTTYDYVATLSYLMKMHYKKINRHSPHQQLINTCKQLLNEYFLWDLLYVLELFHYNIENDDLSEELMLAESSKHLCEYDYVSYLFVKYPDMELAQIIIDWCERCYYIEKKFSLIWDNNFDQYPLNINFLEELALKNKNKTRKRLQKTRHNPFRIDNDSINVYKRNIPDDVHEKIEVTNKKLYQYIRSGKLSKAIEMCLNQGQYLRAATMEGWRLEHIENNTRVEGNQMRLKWRQICEKISNNKNYDIYERAFYGSFISNINVQMEVMECYRDLIWAYCKLYLDKKISSPIESSIDLNHILSTHADTIFKNSTEDCYKPIIQLILESLAPSCVVNHEKSTHANLSNIPFPGKLRKAIIDTFNWNCSTYSSMPSSINKCHFLRSLIYLYLLIKPDEPSTDELDGFIGMSEAYFDSLVSNDETDLVPFVLTFLPEDYRQKSFSRLLTKISPIDNKQDILSLASSTQLNIIDMIYGHCDASINHVIETSPNDLDKIINELNDFLDWFNSDQKLWGLVIIQVEKVIHHVIQHFGIFMTNFNEFIITKATYLRNTPIAYTTHYTMPKVYLHVTKITNEYFQELVERFHLEFDILYGIVGFDQWIQSKSNFDDSYVHDLTMTIESTLYNNHFCNEHGTLQKQNNDIYECIIRLWHPYCLLYLGRLYLSQKLYQKALDLSFVSTSFMYNSIINHFTQEQCSIFMDILSSAAYHLLEEDKIPINT